MTIISAVLQYFFFFFKACQYKLQQKHKEGREGADSIYQGHICPGEAPVLLDVTRRKACWDTILRNCEYSCVESSVMDTDGQYCDLLTIKSDEGANAVRPGALTSIYQDCRLGLAVTGLW